MNKAYYNLNYNHKKAIGFSLIELMVAVAIMGVLTSIAIPAYIGYVAKARISNAMHTLEGLKKTAAENYITNNIFPTISRPYTDDTIRDSQISAATSYTNTQIAATENIVGFVQITFNDQVPLEIRGRVLALVALESDNMIRWKCINGDQNGNNMIPDLSIVPTVCR